MEEATWMLKTPLIQKSGFLIGVTEADAKPCPFCGGKPYMQYDIRYPRPKCEPTQAYEVFCSNEKCIMYRQDGVYYLEKKEALNAWNGRV